MDDEERAPKASDWPPKTLDQMSLDALDAYVRALQAELDRVKRIIESRSRERAAANAIFKR